MILKLEGSIPDQRRCSHWFSKPAFWHLSSESSLTFSSYSGFAVSYLDFWASLQATRWYWSNLLYFCFGLTYPLRQQNPRHFGPLTHPKKIDLGSQRHFQWLETPNQTLDRPPFDLWLEKCRHLQHISPGAHHFLSNPLFVLIALKLVIRAEYQEWSS